MKDIIQFIEIICVFIILFSLFEKDSKKIRIIISTCIIIITIINLWKI